MNGYQERLAHLKCEIENADAILIGAGAGLSAAAGLTYSGERFEKNFSEFIEKYQLTDMYSSGFYPFPSPEEKWAYWSKHIQINRFLPGSLDLYGELHQLVADKTHFVITTNVDYQFYMAGFGEERIFAPQGDYGKLQCAIPCHRRLYDNQKLTGAMMQNQHNCRIPAELIPACPVCGGAMSVNIRIDSRFLENDDWKNAGKAYETFIQNHRDKRLLLLELGVGYNTPGIIKYPFEQMTSQFPDTRLVRINRDHPEVNAVNSDRTLVFHESVNHIFHSLAD